MTDKPKDEGGGGNTSPGNRQRNLKVTESPSLTNALSIDLFAESPRLTPKNSRRASPLESDKPTKSSRRSSFTGDEDPDDPIEPYTQSSLVTGDDPSHRKSIELKWRTGLTLDRMEVDADTLSDEEGDITLTQETHVTTSVQGETSNAGDPHVPATGAPQSTALPLSRPTTPPSASFEVAMANFATQENTQTTTNPLTPPSASAEAAFGAFATQPSPTPTQTMTTTMAPRVATSENPQVLVPGSPLSQPPSRAISQIPELPSRINQILPLHKGKEKVTPNTLLAAIISAGGKAQDAMNENPTVPFALRIVGQLLSDSAVALEAIADRTIALGDKQTYSQMAMVRAEYRALIYHVLGDIDKITERDQEAGLPTESLPTDTMAVLRAIADMKESLELDIAAFKIEMREEMDVLKAGRGPSPVVTETQPPKPTLSRKSAPKPAPAPETALPAPPPTHDHPVAQGWGVPAPVDYMDWNDMNDRPGDEEPQVREPTNEAHKQLLENLKADIPGPAETDQTEPNDGFQTVTNKKGKGKTKASYAAAASKAPHAPTTPTAKASTIASAIRSPAKQQVPIMFTIFIPKDAPAPTLAERLAPHQMYQRVNNALRSANLSTSVLQVTCNKKGNLVIHFPHTTGLTVIEKAVPVIQKALALPKESEFKRCSPWSKVVLSRVPTGLDPILGRDTRYLSDELREELLTQNPDIMNKIEITQPPRWITGEANAAGKTISSCTLAFEDDNDGSIMSALMSARLYCFGMTLKVSKWIERPVIKGCDKCQKLDHFIATCRSADFICAICAGRHRTASHRGQCTLCRKELRAPSLSCSHPPKCANCSGPHGAKDPKCPIRSKFRPPIAKALADAEAPRAEAEEEGHDE